MQEIDLDVRYYIYQTFATHTIPPSLSEISGHFGLSKAEVQQSLDRLAEAHQIALAPGTPNIWMAHPFSGVKTDFTAKAGHKEYWGNWAWDIFGISVILNTAAEVHAPCGCGNCDQTLVLNVKPGEPVSSDWLVHFVVPARSFWDRIGYTWATILPFSSKEHLNTWLARKNLPEGYTMSVDTCWRLAQRWYQGRAERDWQRPDAQAAQELFTSLGLTGDFWDLGVQ